MTSCDLLPVAPSSSLTALTLLGGQPDGLLAGIVLTVPDEAKLETVEEDSTLALGPAAASADLRERLAMVAPELCVKLDGAWERIIEGGVDAAAQSAESLAEVLDWTLRSLAPNEPVLEWHQAEGRSTNELHNGKPTRNLRLRYIVRNHPEKQSSLDLYLKSANELIKAIQKPKHELLISDVRRLTPIAMTVESLLFFVVSD